MSNDSIGNIIKNIRKENDLSQQQLASILGLNNSTISKWEHDLIIPDITYLKIISEEFNIPLDKLIAGETKSKRKPKTVLLISIIILLETIIIITLAINNLKQEDLSIYVLSSSNKQLIVKGTSVIGNKKIYLSINEIILLYEKNGTNKSIVPDDIALKIMINNRVIENKHIENKDKLPIEKILSTISINIEEKYMKKDQIKLELTIMEKDSTSKISTNISHTNTTK